MTSSVVLVAATWDGPSLSGSDRQPDNGIVKLQIACMQQLLPRSLQACGKYSLYASSLVYTRVLRVYTAT